MQVACVVLILRPQRKREIYNSKVGARVYEGAAGYSALGPPALKIVCSWPTCRFGPSYYEP